MDKVSVSVGAVTVQLSAPEPTNVPLAALTPTAYVLGAVLLGAISTSVAVVVCPGVRVRDAAGSVLDQPDGWVVLKVNVPAGQGRASLSVTETVYVALAPGLIDGFAGESDTLGFAGMQSDTP
jgi:hypothetical protein